MNTLRPLLLAVIVMVLFSCEKEYSIENSSTPNPLIIGLDCRISKIVYTDTSGTAAGGTGTGLGSLEAAINSLNFVTRITKFDSLSNVIEFIADPVYISDTVYINAEEYFIVDVNKRIISLHALLDPTDINSLQYDVLYQYNAGGYLVGKTYALTISPAFPYSQVNYTYLGGNLVHMETIDLFSGDTDKDADLTYFSNLIPRRFIYTFPDEKNYPYFTQFFDFGAKNYNAVKQIKVRYYDPGNVLRDSTVSNFSNYILSSDNYVLSVQMADDDQQSIPAQKGKLSFSYKCK